MDYAQLAAQYAGGAQQYGSAAPPPAPYSYPPAPGYTDPYAQPQQNYVPNPASAPQIRNPFAPPPPARTAAFAGLNANYDPEQEAAIAQWQSAYAPQDELDRAKKSARGVGDKPVAGNANMAPLGVRGQPGTQSAPDGFGDAKAKPVEDDRAKTVIRKGGGQTWQDPSLLEWDPTHFRIMVGNLAGEVTDDSLAKAFVNYGVSKARVVRDKRTTKSKGFGFVSFTDGELGFKAAREMVGKYIGSHPVTIQRSKTDIKPTVQKDNRNKGKNNNKNKNKKKEEGGKQDDVLRANTGAHIEKKAIMKPGGMKMLG